MKTYITLHTKKAALGTRNWEQLYNSADSYPDLHTDQVSLHSNFIDTSTRYHEKTQVSLFAIKDAFSFQDSITHSLLKRCH